MVRERRPGRAPADFQLALRLLVPCFPSKLLLLDSASTDERVPLGGVQGITEEPCLVESTRYSTLAAARHRDECRGANVLGFEARVCSMHERTKWPPIATTFDRRYQFDNDS